MYYPVFILGMLDMSNILKLESNAFSHRIESLSEEPNMRSRISGTKISIGCIGFNIIKREKCLKSFMLMINYSQMKISKTSWGHGNCKKRFLLTYKTTFLAVTHMYNDIESCSNFIYRLFLSFLKLH